MKKFAIASMLAILASAAQAAVVQQQYTAVVRNVASPSDTVLIGSTPIATGDKLSGVFSFDNAMVGEPGPLFTQTPYDYGYRGTVQANHITLSLNGVELVGIPAANAGNCAPLDLLCSSTPLVILRGDYKMPGSATDLSLRYTVPVPSNGGLSVPNSGGVRVSSIDLTIFYRNDLPSSALPAQIDLNDQVSWTLLTLNLSNGDGVFAGIESISAPVPEPQTWALMLMALAAVGGVRQLRSKRV
jgi:opacity protein-like surface antigen